MVYLSTLFSLVVALAVSNYAQQVLPPPCQSKIYCHGPLLHTVQLTSPYSDSKTFVDMKMKYSEEITLEKFEQMMNATSHNPTKLNIELFLNETFDPAGSEFEDWDPSDWKENPKFLTTVKDTDLREWGSELNDLWKLLGRKVKNDVKEHPEQYSLIYVPNPVIVPGGRFREFYYWDSYWIVRGLLISEMFDTVKGMLSNFLSIVETYGFIPNGGRIYYTMRSQPPLLAPMMETYYQETKDLQFIKDNIHILEKEFNFWVTNHTVEVDKDGTKYILARYGDASSGPRPESYGEDYESAHIFSTEKEREEYYSELKAAAESGWDFSTRWFILNATNQGNITNLKTRSIIPVDLNAIIYWNIDIITEFYRLLEMPTQVAKYEKIAETWMTAVTEILWHEEVGAWLDYDIKNEKKRDYFYPSNIAPLWTGCYDKTKRDEIVTGVMKYLQKTQIMTHFGGIPTTLEHSGEQWDYPNAWPPLQHLMIMGLDKTGDAYAQELAYEISERWVRANYKGFKDTHAMFEKYDATVPGGYGGGGEYELQLGFGWTNGVILDLLVKYGNRLTAEEKYEEGPDPYMSDTTTVSHSAYPAIVCLCLAIASCIGAFAYKRRHSIFQDGSICPKFCGGYTELRSMTVG